MRITHVVGTNNFAGVERYVVDVARRQALLGNDVQVYGGAPSMMKPLLEGTGVAWLPHSPASALVRDIIRGGRRDVLHSHLTVADFCAAAARPLTMARHVSTRHIIAPRGFRRGTRVLGRVLRSTLSKEIAVSAWTNAQLDRPADVVVLNGVPRQADVVTPREPIVLMAQRLVAEKDTITGLRAWAHSRLADKGWQLQVAGRGEEQRALEAEARDLGISDSVEFMGWVEGVSELMQKASLFLAPAPTEPCGLSILEAMSWGTPVVAAASGGNVETIGSVEGATMFPPRDSHAAGEQLAELSRDFDLRAAYGDAIRAVQREQFSIEAHVDYLMKAYPKPGKWFG